MAIMASDQPPSNALAARWRQCWPAWIGYVTFVWSLLYSIIGLAWTLGAPGYPYGPEHDPDAPLSALAGLSAETGGLVIAGLSLVGAAIALTTAGAWSSERRIVIHVVGWTLAALLLLVVPDYRVLVAVAYAPIFLVGAPFGWPPVNFGEAVPWPVVHQLICITGGLLWVATVVGFEQRRPRVYGSWERPPTSAGWRSPAAAARWGRVAVIIALLIPCFYAATRWAWALGIPFGVSEEFLESGQSGGVWWAGAALATLALAGAALTLGLAQRWGEVFPGWLPRLGGRRVPPALAIVPAALVALIVTEAGLMFVRLALAGFWAGEWENWGAIVPELLWPVWGIALALATLAYYYRRRDRGTLEERARGASHQQRGGTRLERRVHRIKAGTTRQGSTPSDETLVSQEVHGGESGNRGQATDQSTPLGGVDGGAASTPSQPSRRRAARIAKLVVLVALATMLGLTVGIGVLIGIAAVTDRVPLFLLAGFVAYSATFGLALLGITRGIDMTRRRRTRQLVFGAVTVFVVGVFAVTVLVPMDDPRLPSAEVPGQRYWDLPTGSRIAYVHVPAATSPHPEPVVFLHGGPGVPDLAGDSAYFGALARDGFDVYVYEQVGRGRSSRLPDPRAYTLERDVTDLEAIRQVIGTERMTLIGLSNGGKIAAAYAAAFPKHVSKLVLTSPGDPAPGAGGASMTGRLSCEQQLGVYALLLHPRALLGYVLLQVNPLAAHAFVGDAEMDARFDPVYNRTRPALHCARKPPGPELHGLGFYAHYYPQSAARVPHADFLPALAEVDAPALIIKGRCDYLSWSSALAYRAALPDAQLIYFEQAGHNVYQDEPDRYQSLLRAFLLDQPLPESLYDTDRIPADYEGPQ